MSVMGTNFCSVIEGCMQSFQFVGCLACVQSFCKLLGKQPTGITQQEVVACVMCGCVSSNRLKAKSLFSDYTRA